MYQDSMCLKGIIYTIWIFFPLLQDMVLQVATNLYRTEFRQSLSLLNWNDIELFSAGQAISVHKTAFPSEKK